MRPALILAGVLGALAVVAGVPTVGEAAGFGPVRSLSPVAGSVDTPTAAVASNGETAVLWRRFGPRSRDFQYVAAIGRDAEHLRRPAIVRAGRRAASTGGRATLLARPGGGFAVCFGDRPYHRAAVLGCSFSTASGRFGPLRVVERGARRQRPDLQAAVRADGTLAVVLARRVNGGRQQLRSTTLDAGGGRGPLRSLATIGRQSSFSLATTDDGTTAVAWSTPQGRDQHAKDWGLSLRLAAPGEELFGPSQTFLGDGTVSAGYAVDLQGGRELRMLVSGGGGDVAGPVIVRRLPDGSFSAPLRLPRPAPGALSGAVVSLADGSPLAVSLATVGDADGCTGTTAGVAGSGPLAADSEPGPSSSAVQRLSKPGQLALDPAAASLADGTVISSWHDVDFATGGTRLEVALRPPGASGFQTSQVLPQFAERETALAAGGNQAVLAWVVGDLPEGPAHVVVSGLRQAPPYAASARLAKRPRDACW